MNSDTVSHYNNTCQSSYPEDCNFNDTNPPIQTPINLFVPSHTQGFQPTVPLPDNFDIASTTMNIMNYGNTGNSTSYHDNPSDSYYYTRAGNVDTMNGLSNIPYRLVMIKSKHTQMVLIRSQNLFRHSVAPPSTILIRRIPVRPIVTFNIKA